MKVGDTFTVTELQLDQTIVDGPKYGNCLGCLVAIAAEERFGVTVSITGCSIREATGPNESKRFAIIAQPIVGLFDSGELEQLRELLPYTIELTEY
tara:strand:- start:442 stop:729 length:288 start_codon:yes stop_codon:yes gene_type:complete